MCVRSKRIWPLLILWFDIDKGKSFSAGARFPTDDTEVDDDEYQQWRIAMASTSPLFSRGATRRVALAGYRVRLSAGQDDMEKRMPDSLDTVFRTTRAEDNPSHDRRRTDPVDLRLQNTPRRQGNLQIIASVMS